ncbi:MAG TPA: SRPBCC family protein [Bryobacteraceae bacterium]|nr:SRPBCC family protein [Bryobacteraceae bacterium]
MRIGVTELIDAPADGIFVFSQDYSKRLAWDPFLREAILLGNDGALGVGTRSWCVAWFGMGMETEYVSYEPPRVVAVKMTKGPWILKRFAASWIFHSIEANRTEVAFVYSFQIQPHLRVLTPIVGAMFRYEIGRRLRSLKKACEIADVHVLSGPPTKKAPTHP